MALGVMLVLGISTTAVIDYTVSGLHSSTVSSSRGSANTLAEAGLQAAYSVISSVNNNATDGTLLGCDANGANCVPQCVSVTATCPNSTAQNIPGTATYYGTYSSMTNPQFWTITATGYTANPSPGRPVLRHTMTATTTVLANTNDPRNVAVWNHLYSTAPQGSGCEVNVTNTSVYIDVPVYVTGDFCLSGQYDRVWEQPGGQAVDLRVGGKVVLANSDTSIGYKDSHNNVYKITSAEVGQGCTTTIGGTASSCTSGAFQYYVRSSGTFTPLDPPTIDTSWYSRSDPGPTRACKSGSNVPYTPGTTTPISGGVAAAGLASTVFDNDTTANRSVMTTFDLTPAYSYTCLSQIGSGELAWVYDSQHQTGTLYISGVVYIDGNVTVSHGGLYNGTGSLYVGGTFSMGGSGLYLCAVAGCFFGNWNPNSEMLMIVALAPNTTAIDLSGWFDIFQGALFADTTSSINLDGSSAYLQGPLVAGKFVFNQYTAIQPLPAVNNLPPGAPLAVNARAIPQPLVITGG